MGFLILVSFRSMPRISLECISTWRQLTMHASGYPGIMTRCCLVLQLPRWLLIATVRTWLDVTGGEWRGSCHILLSNLSIAAKRCISIWLEWDWRALQCANWIYWIGRYYLYIQNSSTTLHTMNRSSDKCPHHERHVIWNYMYSLTHGAKP